MGRHSDYTVKGEKEKISPEEARAKLGKEDMSPADFVPLLEERRGFPVEEKTIKNYVIAICEESGGILTQDDFKKEPKGAYKFAPSYNELLLTLMSTDHFDKRKNSARISTRASDYQQLLKSIDLLPENLQETIKEHPTYMDAKIECELYERTVTEMGAVLSALCSVDILVRYHRMYQFLLALIRFRKEVMEEDALLFADEVIASRCQYPANRAENCLKRRADLSDTIWDFIICLIALKMQGLDFQYISENEVLSIPAFALANKLFHIQSDSSDRTEHYQEMLEQIDTEIENTPRYRELISQIEMIFDLEDPKETAIYKQIEKILQINYLRAKISQKDYDRIRRFTENNLEEAKKEILEDLDYIKSRATEF